MPTLYALLSSRNIEQGPHEAIVEVVDLQAKKPKLQTVIPLGKWRATSFAVSEAQQRLYVVDRTNGRIVVRDTSGMSIAQIALSGTPYDCVLSADGAMLFVSTTEGLVSLDTSALQVVKTKSLPAVSAKNVYHGAPLALSPKSTGLSVLGDPDWEKDPHAPAPLWLVDPGSLTPIKQIWLPRVHGGQYVGIADVTYAGDARLVLLGLPDAVGVLDLKPKPKPQPPAPTWIPLDPTVIDKKAPKPNLSYNGLNRLVYASKSSRAYCLSMNLDKEYADLRLWSVDLLSGVATSMVFVNGSVVIVDGSVQLIDVSYICAPGVPCLEPGESSLYFSMAPLFADVSDAADTLSRYYIASKSLATQIYTFSRKDLSVIGMQIVGGSVFDSGGLEDFYAAELVYILIGVAQGGGGWVLTPGGKIKPDPAPLPRVAGALHSALARVLRASMVAMASGQVTDRNVRRQIRREALAYAKRQLSQLKLTKQLHR